MNKKIVKCALFSKYKAVTGIVRTEFKGTYFYNIDCRERDGNKHSLPDVSCN